MLPALRSALSADFVIANGENSAGGFGITSKVFSELSGYGVDFITLGNHAFSKKNVFNELEDEIRMVRPANLSQDMPGRGVSVVEACGLRACIINLQGRTFMEEVGCPFAWADELIEEYEDKSDIIIVDFHAEASSEKKAFGFYLDGRVSAVIGTHTHVQTSDERVLAGGTAYMTDAGMTGVRDSVIGMDTDMVVERFRLGLTGKLKLAEGLAVVEGVVMDLDENDGRAISVAGFSIDEDADVASYVDRFLDCR